MVAINPGDHFGGGNLRSAVAMVGPWRRRGGFLVEMDAGTNRPAAARTGTNRLLLLHRLGGADHLQPIPRSSTTAQSADAGLAADRGRRANSAGRRPAAGAQTRHDGGAARAVH